jgi:rifampicin phosphotransferase
MRTVRAATRVPAIVAVLGDDTVDTRLLGGKGASLDRLARLGFDVPPGFCLTVAAFEAHLAAIDGAADLIERLPDEAARETLARLVIESPLPVPVADAREGALEPLATRPLAVRSSAVDEDGTVASFAGLHETELGVAADDVPAATARCWASLWSREAVAYRLRRGLSLTNIAMAVVVQALVPADAAIVAFTRHPVTGRDDEMLINAAPGLGEAMVSGTVTPDTIVVDKSSRSVVEFVPGDGTGSPVLSPAGLDSLVDLALSVERSFGEAVDIEAAVADGRWYLLQARPITTH